MLVIEELDEPVLNTEIELVVIGAEEDVLAAIELGKEAGLALNVELVDMVKETDDVELDIILEGTFVIELAVKLFDTLEETDDVELVTDETVLEMLVDGKVLVAGDETVLEILVDVELDIAESELLVGGILVELETLVVVEEACADDMLEIDELGLGLPLDVMLDVTEADELGPPLEMMLDVTGVDELGLLLDVLLGVTEVDVELGLLELLLLDAVLLWSEVVRDIGVDVELFELVDEDEDDIDDDEVVSFPSVTLVKPPVQSACRAQMSAQHLLGA